MTLKKLLVLVGLLIVTAVVLAACGGAADAAPDAYHGPASALFEVPRAVPPPSGFYALP